MKLLNSLEHRRNNWQILFLQDGLPDISMHQGNFKDIIEAYSLVDELIGLAFEICESNNWYLFIVSDHGCQEAKWIFSIGTYLVVKRFAEMHGIDSLTKLGLIMYQLLLSKLTRIDPKFSKTIINIIKYLRFRCLRNCEKSITQFYDATSTIIPYFSAGSNFANLWINKELSWRDLLHYFTNLSIVEKIHYPIDSIVNSEYLIPLILEFKQGIRPEHMPFSRVIFKTNGFMHRKYATFIAYGPMIKSSFLSHTINIIDFLPTLLAMIHVPIPTDRRGHIIVDMFESKDFIKIHYISKSKIAILMKIRGLKEALMSKKNASQ